MVVVGLSGGSSSRTQTVSEATRQTETQAQSSGSINVHGSGKTIEGHRESRKTKEDSETN